MNKSLPNTQNFASVANPSPQKHQQLVISFCIFALGLFVYELFLADTDSLVAKFAAILITATALIPGYLWCSGRALGMPVFPLLALTYIWTYAFPLVINHPFVLNYSEQSQLFAGATVAGFLGLGTLIWFPLVKSAPPLPDSYRALNHQQGTTFFLFILAVASLFKLSITANWLILDPGVFSLVRVIVLGLTSLSSFVVAYRLGTRSLSKFQSQLFITLMITYMITDAIHLLLVGIASTFLVTTVGFIFGRKKIPILVIVIFILCLSFLHPGKYEMRAKYWSDDELRIVQPWEYPAQYGEWLGYSWDELNKGDDLSRTEEEENSSFFERASVVHMLLLAQDKSPKSIPYLYGKTYEILPQLLVPRIFNRNKIFSHEGTSIMSVHYGLQNREQSLKTTIGWGLLAEAYANFGLFGCAGLGIILGGLYGKVTQWSINAPILSDRSLCAVVLLTFAFQTEWSAGVYFAALSQSMIVIGVIVVVFMKTYKVPRFFIK